MSIDKSDRFLLPLLQTAQSQKELTHNEALVLIDFLLHPQAESASLTSPPAGAVAGQCWIVATGGTGVWLGHDSEIACLTASGWRFTAPRAGVRVAVTDDGLTHIYDGFAWTLDAARSDGYYVAGTKVVGTQQLSIADPSGGSVIDTTARGTLVEILTALRNHGLIA